MFGDLFKRFDNIDFGRVMSAVDFIWDNRDKIVDVIERLPQLLNETGQNIETAGASAVKASLFLSGEPNSDKKGANEIAELAASALERCHKELGTVANMLNKVGNEIDDVNIPSFKPKYTEVMNMRVISGLEMGELKLVDQAAEQLRDGSERVHEIAADLQNVANYLRELGGILTDTGGNIHTVGQQLQQSGQTLRSFINPQA